MGKIIITDNVIDKVIKGKYTVNEALASEYEGEIQDRLSNNKICEKMTPLQMALYDAGVNKRSIVKDVVNQGITTAGAGHWLLPAFIDTTLHETVERQDVLSYVCNTTVTTPSRNVDSAYLDLEDAENKKNAKLARVSEGADLPLAKLKIGERAIRLQKYGRAVQQTYEAMSEMTVDMLAKTIEVIGKTIVKDELNDAVLTALDGDGNNNAAEKLGETATSGVITQDELIDYLVDFYLATGVEATTIVASPKLFKQLNRMVYPTNNAFGANARFTLNAPQISSKTLNVIMADVPQKSTKDVGILLNTDIALTKYILNGSKISEYDNNIQNQTKLGTISEIVGFGKTFPNAVKYFAVK